MITIAFPRPISLNQMNVTVAGKRRLSPAYSAWKKEAKQLVMMQRPKLPRIPPMQPVGITFLLGEIDVSPGMDGDNCLKPILDVLVEMKVIADDNRGLVRAGQWSWQPELQGCIVLVYPYTFEGCLWQAQNLASLSQHSTGPGDLVMPGAVKH